MPQFDIDKFDAAITEMTTQMGYDVMSNFSPGSRDEFKEHLRDAIEESMGHYQDHINEVADSYYPPLTIGK